MIDLTKTLNLIKGGLLEPRATWESYHAENRDWKDTATLLTGPLIIGATVLSAVLSWVFRHHHMFGVARGGVLGLLLNIVLAAISIGVVSFVFSFLARTFGGEHDLNRGLAAASLAAIPSYVGSVVGTLPWIGWLLSLALMVVGLVFLYQIIPLYLKVPEDKRVLHYVVSLVVSIVVVFVIATILGVGGGMARHPGAMMGDSMPPGAQPYGMFGGLERQSDIVESAEQDRFTPPADGRISESQMERYLDDMRKTSALRSEQEEQIKKLESQSKAQGEGSVADLGKMASGINALLGTATAEMEVVKTAGGNWAEHQWIKEQLRLARVQKDINESVRYNHSMYEKYAAELERYDALP